MSATTTGLSPDASRLPSRAECDALWQRIAGFRTRPWDCTLTIRTTWSQHFRWGRNRPTAAGDTLEQVITLASPTDRNGEQQYWENLTASDDDTLRAMVQRIERRVLADPPSLSPAGPLPLQHYLAPPIWDEATSHVAAQQLADMARQSVEATRGGPLGDSLVASGYVDVGAASWAIYNPAGLAAYATMTGARYSATVRTLDGSASGWAARRSLTWSQLDPATLATTARERCLASAHAVAIEPGRYTAVLTADMVCELMHVVMGQTSRKVAEQNPHATIFSGPEPGTTLLGTRVMDTRLTVSSDPSDPECGYIPFDDEGNPYTKVKWITNGILTTLSYSRDYAYKKFGTAIALPNPRAFRMSGGPTATTTLDEMIATTERGVLVTHDAIENTLKTQELPVTSVTRDGLWLIEQGKITHAIKNMWFTEHPMEIFNKVLQIGPTVVTSGVRQLGFFGDALRDLPARALCDGYTALAAPPMKVQDFNFTQLTGAI